MKLPKFSFVRSKGKPASTAEGRVRVFRSHGPFVALAALLLTGLILASAALLRNDAKEKENSTVQKPVCTDDYVKKVMPDLTTEDDKLRATAEDIRKQPGHETEVNCLYILVLDSISRSDSVQASSDMEKLGKLYNPQVGLSKEFGTKLRSVDSLKMAVNDLQKRNEQYRKNSIILNGEPKR